MKTKSKVWLFIGTLLFLGLIYYMISLAVNNQDSCTTQPAKEINIGSHNNLALHIHAFLTITINGEAVEIPANIGIEPGIMRPTHTHDTSGKIHIEGPCPRTFTLGDFFDVWGQTLNETCVMNSCEDATHMLTMYVNGIESTEYRNLILKDGDKIELVYGEI